MFNKKASKPQNRIDSLIGAGTRIEGNVLFSGGLRVDGEIIGNVAALPEQPSTLVISEQARVEGEIKVTHLVVNGTVLGPVAATEFLELQSRSRVKGDVHYSTLEMHLGAIVDGRLVHSSSEAKTVELKLASSKPIGSGKLGSGDQRDRNY
ncbi:MAG: polymer-forming cytoskeletal family protein [Betaproteobacteria bacterium]|nr:polymer-forming cytoskeletal family protein [Betaproteobacteria bacterium]